MAVKARRRGPAGTFLFVHGAWHGGWCWGRVAQMLRDVGHTVHAPSLTGLGDRAHLAHPDVDLATHVQDVVGLLEMDELRQVVLVGHGYGGMVVSGVAVRAAARLAHLVYLDAFVPGDREAVLDLLAPEKAAGMRVAAREHGEGWRIPPFSPAQFGVTNAKDAEWLARHLVPQPLKTFDQGVEGELPVRLKKTYLYCASPAIGSFDRYRRLQEDRQWKYHELATGHDAMVTAAGEVARILLQTL
jgi:pimeloyl-ACP methyl ester carboxylesterase